MSGEPPRLYVEAELPDAIMAWEDFERFCGQQATAALLGVGADPGAFAYQIETKEGTYVRLEIMRKP